MNMRTSVPMALALALAFGLACGDASDAAAQAPSAAVAPSALVEEVTGTPRGVEFMDYLSPGQVISLGPRDGLVLSYLTSCRRETILGGVVTVGQLQSKVEGGAVAVEIARCDGAKLNLSLAQAETAGAVVVRSLTVPDGKPDAKAAADAPLTLYGRAPLATGPAGAALIVERLDQPGDRIDARLSARGTFDFARLQIDLAPGGLYRATVGGRSISFQIAADAAPGASPALGRLLRFAAP